MSGPAVFGGPGELLGAVGRSFGPTDWLQVTQQRIDTFADATGDHQWVHVDAERAAAGVYGGTIAHGYLTLALTNLFLPALVEVRGISAGINYGLDRVRFPAPVACGARIRGRAELTAAVPVDGGVQSTVRVTVEIAGVDRPACVADTLTRWLV